MLSIGLADKISGDAQDIRWNSANDRVGRYLNIEDHRCIIRESHLIFFHTFFSNYGENIFKASWKLMDYCKVKSREKLGKAYVRIEPDFGGSDHGFDACSFAEAQRFMAFTESTLSQLERNKNDEEASLCWELIQEYKNMLDEFEPQNEILTTEREGLINNNYNSNNINRNFNTSNENYINKVSLSKLRDFFFTLRITNNTLSDLNHFAMNAARINPNSFSRQITRYQRFPLCYNKISVLLKELQNQNLTEQQITDLNARLLETLKKFHFRNSDIQFYKNISAEDSRIELPCILFKSGIKGITYAIAIGHLGLINYFRQKDNIELREFQDYYLWSSYHTAIANDELISFIAIVRDLFPLALRANGANYSNNVNNTNGNFNGFDENDIRIENFIEEDEAVCNDFIRRLNNLKSDLETKRCKYWFDLFGCSRKNGQEFIKKYNSYKIKDFIENLNQVLRRNQLDIIII